MTEPEFKLFRDLIYAESGMYLRSGKKELNKDKQPNLYWYFHRIIKDE
jgi:hypothetical protein